MVYPILKKFDISIVSKKKIESSFNILKTEEVYAETSLIHNLLKNKEFLYDWQCLYPNLYLYEKKIHEEEIIDLSLTTEDPFTFSTVSKDRRVKIFNEKMEIIGDIYTGINNPNPPLEKWKFKASISTKIIQNENNDNLSINNTYNFNTNLTNESFDSNSNINYSRDMSNNSLSIRIDNNNKFRVSLVSKPNDIAINNNLSSFCFNKEKKIYEENKLYEKTEEIQKINLFQNIILNINQNDVNSALKNCEYFLQKYQNSTLFLHPLIFLCLAFIYNKIDGLDSAQKYIKKSLKYLTWLYPYQNCFHCQSPFICDLNF